MLLVLFPFLFWYYTWFGRPLTARDLDQVVAFDEEILGIPCKFEVHRDFDCRFCVWSRNPHSTCALVSNAVNKQWFRHGF